MKKYRVEFNETGYYSGQGIFDTLEEFTNMECESAAEAIEYAVDYMTENDSRYGETDTETIRKEYEGYAWRAAEIHQTQYGEERGAWEFDNYK